jgi:two-component sensor histidine kinase
VLSLQHLTVSRQAGANGADGSDVRFRADAVQGGSWLGWASILVVLTALALGVGVRHPWLLVGATLAAAIGNAVATVVPWHDWLVTARGRALLDAWCGGLIAFVALLVVDGGSSFALLLFLAAPFIAVVQTGWRRGFWLTAAAGTCVLIAVVLPLSAEATAMRLSLVGVAAAVAVLLVHAVRREAARADIARLLAHEADHRIKNDLQTVADLLLLDRPDGLDGRRFDKTAARIRSIATVHRLLTESGDRVDGAALLHDIAAHAPVPVAIDADAGTFDAATAQKLGLVANELVTNAFQHGESPIVVRLRRGAETTLSVEDGGGRVEPRAGFGLEMVRSLIEQGLGGRFELRAAHGERTRAEAVFSAATR